MLQRALNSWPEWGLGFTRQPTVLGSLDGGLTNRSYLLDGTDCRWVLRLNADNSQVLDIDRAVEQRILAATAQADLSPRRYFCDPQLGILVTEYLTAWQPTPVNDQHLMQLAQQMYKLHQLDVAEVPVVGYVEYTERYVQRLRDQSLWSAELAALRDQYLPGLERFQASPVATARLCHHDPSPAHWRLQNGELCLIDWEYAALRDPACDLALLTDGWRLSAQQIECLLSHYSGAINVERLRDAQHVCQYLNNLWFALQNTNTQHEN